MTILERPDADVAALGAGDTGTDDPADSTPWGLASPMRVRKRDGAFEPIDLNKIVRAVGRASRNADGTILDGVDPMRVATRTISGLHDGATTMELDELSIRTAAALVSEEPSYSRLAGRLLATFVHKEVFNQNIHSFSQSILAGHAAGLINDETADLVANHAFKLNDAIDHQRDHLFEYFGLRTVYDRYLLRDPEGRLVIETPQYFFMRVACGLSTTADEAIEFYRIISSLDYMPATPTLFNCGTAHPQMSSCYLARLARRHPRVDLRPLHRRRPAVEVRRRHRPGVPPGAQPGLADPGHQRPEQRHRPVAQDARLVGVGGQPGRQAQGRGVRVPRDVARRHRGVPRAPRQHRRRGAAHPQPQPRQLGARPVHAARRERLDVVAVRPEGGAAPHRPVRRGVRARLRRGRGARSCSSARSRPASSTRG